MGSSGQKETSYEKFARLRGQDKNVFTAIALMAAAGCILFVSDLATGSPYQVASAHAAQKKPCKNRALSLQSDHLEAEEACAEAAGLDTGEAQKVLLYLKAAGKRQ